MKRNAATRASIISLLAARAACATFVACYICSAIGKPHFDEPTNDGVIIQQHSSCLPALAAGLLGPDAMTIDPVALAAQLIRCPSVTPARGRSVRRARGGAGAARLHGPSLGDGRTARRADREHGRDPRLGIARISASPAISTSCPPAKAGAATRSPREIDDGAAGRPRRQRHEERDRRLRRRHLAARARPAARCRC